MSTPFAGVDLSQFDPPQRLDMIAALWDSLSDSIEETPVPEWHREELDRRIAAADAAPEAAVPWEEALAKLRKRP
jgi:putative addiction module component (TIGR02574 family)